MSTTLAVSDACPGAAAAAEGDEDIPNIVVTDRRDPASEELRGSKIRLPARDIPLSAERLDAEAIERTGYTNLGALLQATSSVAAIPAEGGVSNDFLLRGFADTPIYRNGINDSFGSSGPVRSIANIEHIEILKGPYGALYGPGEPGGSINFVTKKPQAARAAELALGFASFDESILQLDATGALLPRFGIDYRLIARREQGDTFRTFAKRDRLFVNPMLAWQPHADVRFDASFEYLGDERLFDTGVVAVEGALPLPRDRFLGEPGDGTGRTDAYTLQTSAQTRLSDTFALEVVVSGHKSLFDGAAAEPDELVDTADGILLNRAATRRDEVVRALNVQAEVSGVAHWGSLPHHALVGTSAAGVDEDVAFYASDPDEDPFAIDPLDPVYGAAAPAPAVQRDSQEQTRQYAIYAQDLLVLGERWRILIGLRFDHIRQSGSDAAVLTRFARTSDEVSPRAGIVFKPAETWALFASYSSSIDPNEGLRPDGSGLEPTESKALETGVKWRAPALPVSVDASLFAIRQTNVTTDAPGDPGFELQTGEQESIGADVEINAEPWPWLSLTARYAFVDAEIRKDTEIPDGTTPLNVAKHHFSTLALMRASLVRADDVSFGMALNYLSDRHGSLETDELSLSLPGYFRGDLFLVWSVSRRLRCEFYVENFTDERYISGSQADALHLFPGAPVTFRGQIAFAF